MMMQAWMSCEAWCIQADTTSAGHRLQHDDRDLAFVLFVNAPDHHAHHRHDHERHQGLQDEVSDDGYNHVADDLVLVVIHRLAPLPALVDVFAAGAGEAW